jgi:hypothetical protein
MVASFKDYGLAVAQMLGAVVSRAAQPSARVARHWKSTRCLTWFGACADHHLIQVSWSFGELLDGPPLLAPQRATVGTFALTRITFPEVDELKLRALCEGMVPVGTDGATRVFLQRVASQLAVCDVLLTLPELVGCEVSLFARPDALEQPASTARWPEHARDRVAAALAAMDPAFAKRCERTWTAEPRTLLDAVRGLRVDSPEVRSP